MSGRGIDQRVLITDGSGVPAQVDASGNLQTDVNNSISIDDSTPIDVNVVTSSDDAYTCYFERVTTTGDSELIAAQGSGKKIRLHRFHVGQGGTVAATVGFKFGSGSVVYQQKLEAGAANITIGYGRTVNIEGGDNEALNFNSDTASVDFDVTIEYEVLDV